MSKGYQALMLRKAEEDREREKLNLVKMDWCSFCREEMFDDGFMHDVWDKLRFGGPISVTEEEWARQAKRHKPDCPWIKARGDCFWTA